MQPSVRNEVATFGPNVMDIIARSLQHSGHQTGTKRECRFEIKCGGGATNVGSHLQTLGCRPAGVLLMGPQTDFRVSRELEARFPEAYQLPVLERSRMSILLPGGTCYTDRSPATVSELPENYRHIFSTAAWSVVAPMLAQDNPLVRSVMKCSNRTVLLLSSDQLQQEDRFSLMAEAYMVILNDQELQAATGESDRYEGINILRDHGVRKVVVTSRDSVLAYANGGFIYERAFEVQTVRQSVGAGDVFTASLVASLASGDDLRTAIQSGLAGAADHVEGRNPARSLKELQRRATGRERQPFVPPRTAVSPSRTVVKWLTAAAGLLLPFVWGAF